MQMLNDEPESETEDGEEKKTEGDPKILSCSLDNTIRFWDSKDMSTVMVVENSDEQSEFSCMAYLSECGLVATGHEDGHIRLWNLEIEKYDLLTEDPKYRHGSTVSCIKAINYKGVEYLICGSFDQYVSIWEIAQKSGGKAMIDKNVYPQFR